MPREYEVYLDDILASIDKIERYTKEMSYGDFAKNEIVIDAVIRNLEIIGEAVKSLPSTMKKEYNDVEWRKIAGLRDILIHEYFGINLKILWDVVVNKISELKVSVNRIRDRLDS